MFFTIKLDRFTTMDIRVKYIETQQPRVKAYENSHIYKY